MVDQGINSVYLGVKMLKKLSIVILIIFLIFTIFILFSDYRSLFNIRAKDNFVDFKIFQDTPGYKDEFPSQGIVVIDSKLIINNHHFDNESWIYEIDINTREINRSFIMPLEANHVGGLCWDGQFLYAVDYNTNKVYQIDYHESFNTGNAVIMNEFDTTLEGASACGIILDREIPLLIISDFRNSSKTLIVDLNKSIKSGTAENNILYSYENESFSQGISYWNGLIFEVENKVFKSIVNIYDFNGIASQKLKKDFFIGQFLLPDRGGQDIYIDDKKVFLSDSVTFKIYEAENTFNVDQTND